jgi:Cu/Ag efflux protein CusF
MHRLSIIATVGFIIALAACSQEAAKTEPAKTQPAPAAQATAEKKPHVFRGKVEHVDLQAKTLTVNGENVEGWMSAMTMTYSADKPDVIDKVKAGDEITAKVFDGDFATLHDVQVVK